MSVLMMTKLTTKGVITLTNIEVIRSDVLSSEYDSRYVVVEKETGKILDDAQGYGYKTVRAAHAAYAYKTRDKSKDKAKAQKRRQILS